MMERCDGETRLPFPRQCHVNIDQFIVWLKTTCRKARVFESTDPGFLLACVPSQLLVAIVRYEKAPMPLDVKQRG